MPARKIFGKKRSIQIRRLTIQNRNLHYEIELLIKLIRLLEYENRISQN